MFKNKNHPIFIKRDFDYFNKRPSCIKHPSSSSSTWTKNIFSGSKKNKTTINIPLLLQVTPSWMTKSGNSTQLTYYMLF